MAKSKKLVIISYFLIYTLWSTTYLAIKIAVKTFPTFTFVGLRWFISGLIILGLALFSGKKMSLTKKELFNSILIGFFMLYLGNGLLSEAEKNVDSYIAAVTFAATPILMTLFDYFINKIKIAKATFPGIFIGIIGVGVLHFTNSTALSLDFGTILLILSLSMWAFGSALSHKVKLPENLFLNLAVQMISAGVLSLVTSFIQGHNPFTIKITTESLLALGYLVFPCILGMVAYVYLLKHEPLSRVSSYTFVNTIGAVFLGLFFGEKLNSNFFFALPLILVGLFLMLNSRVKEPHMETEAER
ncbi:MAG: EamA family transporter [archaeon]